MEKETTLWASIPWFVWLWAIIIVSLLIGFLVFWLFAWLQIIIVSLTLTSLFLFSGVKYWKKICEIQISSLEVSQKREMVRKYYLKNEELQSKNQLIERVAMHALTSGLNVKMHGLEITDWRSNIQRLDRSVQEQEKGDQMQITTSNIVYADEIDVPDGHYLIGVGCDGPITAEKSQSSCVWVVGVSGSGKTNTVSRMVCERVRDDARLLVVDPHRFKPDSLTNALENYRENFLKQPVSSTEDSISTVEFFLEEFNSRKNNTTSHEWYPVALIVDEVGALCDIDSKEEKRLLALLKTCSRICGQEARNFNMSGIFISQTATGLAWLRKNATLVYVHKLLMQNERLLAVNDDRKIAKEMESWPRGRTYVYGLDWSPMTVQQPLVRKGLQ